MMGFSFIFLLVILLLIAAFIGGALLVATLFWFADRE